MCQIDRKRHQRRSLVGGVAEHHALIAGTLCLVTFFAAGGGLLIASQTGNALVDFGALLGDGHHNAAGIGVKADFGGGVADVAQGLADLGLHVAISLRRDFAEDQEHAGGGGGLHGHMAGRILGQQIIKNGVGDLIADLVRVAFGHGFGGNKPMFFCHIIPFFRTYRPAGCEAQ